MRRPAAIHNLSRNEREFSPHFVMVLDTETRPAMDGTDEVHALTCWDLSADYRHGRAPHRPRTTWAAGTTRVELVDVVEASVKTDTPAWLYIHNLSFDLTVTRLPLELMARGWVMGANNLASDAPWCHLSRGRRTLRLVDSYSLFQTSVAKIGRALDIAKPQLPDWDHSLTAWHERCRADVAIVRAAVLELMDWWDAQQAGNWSDTGPRTGWNMMRHQCVPARGERMPIPRGPGQEFWLQHGDGHVVIDPDQTVRRFERATLYGGRRDTWALGQRPKGDYVEMDMTHAHLSVAQHLRLPCRRGTPFDDLPTDHPWLDSDNMGLVADVLLDTRDDRYPLRTPTGIIHPTGRFWTRLAGPEIIAARQAGHLAAIGPGHWYRLSYHMQPWADRIAAILDDDAATYPPATVLAAKAWSRTVPGTWAKRTSYTRHTWQVPSFTWSAEMTHDLYTKAPGAIVQLGHTMMILDRDLEADDSFPAVLAYIQAHVRVALHRALDIAGRHRVVSCSTDSVLLDARAPVEDDGATQLTWAHPGAALTRARILADLLDSVTGWTTWHTKTQSHHLRVYSAQHLILDGARRLSGIPADADETDPGVFAWTTWPKMATQMRLDNHHGYVRQRRTADLNTMVVPRWAYGCGHTAAPEIHRDIDAVTYVYQPADICPACHHAALSTRQHPFLERASRPRL